MKDISVVVAKSFLRPFPLALKSSSEAGEGFALGTCLGCSSPASVSGAAVRSWFDSSGTGRLLLMLVRWRRR